MRKAVAFLTHPVLLVAVLTLTPLVLFTWHVSRSDGLAKQVGADPEFYLYAVTCVLAFGVSFFLSRTATERGAPADETASEANPPDPWPIRRITVLGALAMLAIGTASTLAVLSTIDVGTFAAKLLLAQDPSLRYEVIEADVPGLVRMFAYAVPGAGVVVFGALLARPRLFAQWPVYWALVGLVVLFIFARGVVWMDRSPTIATLVIATVSIVSSVKLGVRWVAVLASLAALLIGNFIIQGATRVSDSENSTIISYADMGMANASLAFRTTTLHGAGLESLATPLTFVPRGLGLRATLDMSNRRSLPDPACNLLGYSYADFGVFGFATYCIWGALAGWTAARRRMAPASFLWANAYLWALFAILTIWTIPIVRGADFWTAAALSFLAGGATDRIGRTGRLAQGAAPVAEA
jgi:hypothetical protein